jgi:hypothetical protein
VLLYIQEAATSLKGKKRPRKYKEIAMTQNVGGVDRIVRIVAGLAIMAAGIYFQNWWGAIGIVPLLTGALGWCPAYLPFKISTK